MSINFEMGRTHRTETVREIKLVGRTRGKGREEKALWLVQVIRLLKSGRAENSPPTSATQRKYRINVLSRSGRCSKHCLDETCRRSGSQNSNFPKNLPSTVSHFPPKAMLQQRNNREFALHCYGRF